MGELSPTSNAQLQAMIQQAVSSMGPEIAKQVALGMGQQQQPQAVAAQQAAVSGVASAAATAAVTAHNAQTKKKESEPREDPWAQYLQSTVVIATEDTAVNLVKLFKEAPDLTNLMKTLKEVPNFKDIPDVPPARSHQQDHQLQLVQTKLRAAMNLFVEAEEENDPAARYTAAAFMRSG